MKKIIFGLQTMVMGGVEKELIAILRHLNPKEWEITVVLMYITDQSIIDLIPQNVRLINLDIDQRYYCSDTFTATKLRLKRGKILEGLSLLCKKILRIGQTGSNTIISEISAINKEFDTAVCFHMHSPLMVKYISEKVTALKKLAWIHNDFSTSGYRVNKITKYLKKYDNIIGVSAKITNEFNNLCPDLASRSMVVYNALDREEIISKANEPIESQFRSMIKDKLFLLTVGRLEEQKGYDIAVSTAIRLKEMGINFVWIFIGEGSKYENIKRLISKSKLDDTVILLGRKDNPYRYMKACDIYVQPSRHEGYPLTVLEAKVLAKPIICTDFAGAGEQISDGKNGCIVSLNNSKALADTIIKLHSEKALQQHFIHNLLDENKTDSDFSEIISIL